MRSLAVAEAGAGPGALEHYMCAAAAAQWGCWQQGPLGGWGEQRALQQVQGLAPVQEQGQSLQWGQQQVLPHYFQQAQADPGWSLRSVGSMVEKRG